MTKILYARTTICKRKVLCEIGNYAIIYYGKRIKKNNCEKSLQYIKKIQKKRRKNFDDEKNKYITSVL